VAAAHALPDRTADAPARVLIVDDSVVARAVMARAVEATGRFRVAAAVADVPAAMRALAAEPVEAILLDIALPGIDGLSALPDLLAASGEARVIMVSASCGDGAAATIQALALGAADTLDKPAAGAPVGRFLASLVEKLDNLADAEPVAAPPPRPQPPRPLGEADAFDAVAIGASTGGIHALSLLLRTLPPSFQLPILITQHLPASFMPYFAAQVAVLAGRPCEVAADRTRVRPGRILIAPGDAHLKLVPLGDGHAAVRLSTEPSLSGCTPSVDPMLDSAAAVWGARLVAVMLSGMGRDGAEGARRVRDAGGTVVAQDRTSSVVWGMPGAVVAAGLADAVMAPDAIGRLVAARRRPA
jgi:two-component system, chemotaxis family, protein-glutamate methylesterase/glutaminase